MNEILAMNSDGVKITGIEYGVDDYVYVEFAGSNETYYAQLNYGVDGDAYFEISNQRYYIKDFALA